LEFLRARGVIKKIRAETNEDLGQRESFRCDNQILIGAIFRDTLISGINELNSGQKCLEAKVFKKKLLKTP
jgi:hypothetical protein